MKHALLAELSVCRDAVDYAEAFPTLEAAWLACERGDWLLWFAAKRGVNRKVVISAACECARLALPFTKDFRVLKCIETTEKWAQGEATINDVVNARKAAFDAANAANAAKAAVYAAYAAAYAAVYAAYAADAANDANAAVYAAVGAQIRLRCADIVRRYIPTLP